MKPLNCGKTFVPLQVGHFGFAFSRSGRFLAMGGVTVWLDANYQAAHNMVVIVDADSANATTITGSYNFTNAAQWHNAENVVILRDNRQVARAFRDNWLRLKAKAAPWPGTQ